MNWFVKLIAILTWVWAVSAYQGLGCRLSGPESIVPYVALGLLCLRMVQIRFRRGEVVGWRLLITGSLSLVALIHLLQHSSAALRSDSAFMSVGLFSNVVCYVAIAASGIAAVYGATDENDSFFRLGIVGLIGCMIFAPLFLW